MPPHSLPLRLIGAGLLWTGWSGFNAGSALSASPLAALAFLNTGTAASAAVVAWAAVEGIHRGKPTTLGGAWGALASGLFATTPGSGVETNAQQVMVQLTGIGFVAVFAPVMTRVILTARKVVFGSLTVSEEEEAIRLDLPEHQKSAYRFPSGMSSMALHAEAEATAHLVAAHTQRLA